MGEIAQRAGQLELDGLDGLYCLKGPEILSPLFSVPQNGTRLSRIRCLTRLIYIEESITCMLSVDARLREIAETAEVPTEPKVGCVLPEGAGPADWWLAVLIDPSASAARRDEAARELRRLGARAIAQAQDRRSAMEEDRWWASLSEAEQRELLRKGQGPRG
jgi:hypothetical protein